MKYYQPKNIAHLEQLLADGNRSYTILAGGTDVLVEARQKPLIDEKQILDISRLKELATIEEQDDQIVLGALSTHQQIATSPLILKFAPLLADACKQVGALQIRNRGTIGGNICNASPCADTVPPLAVLNADVEIISAAGKRTVSIEDFFDKPYHPRLQPNEVVTQIRLKKLNTLQKSAFFKLGRRNALAISRINMAAVLETDQTGIIQEVRLAPGSVFPTWNRVVEAEQYLTDKQATRDNFEVAGKIVADKMIEISGRRWSTPYKEPVVAALVCKVLSIAAGME